MLRIIFIVLISISLIGCDSDRIARLEKQNEEIKAQLQQSRAAAELDLQAKCSKDAKTFFSERAGRDKDTLLLDYFNHYNKRENKCFIIIENHYNSHFAEPRGQSWTNDMVLYDVYENEKYGNLAENHYTYYKPQISTHDEMLSCAVSGKKCNSLQEFNSFVAPFMNE